MAHVNYIHSERDRLGHRAGVIALTASIPALYK